MKKLEQEFIAGKLHIICTISAAKLLRACTCVFTTDCGTLRMQKTDALNTLVRSHLFFAFHASCPS